MYYKLRCNSTQFVIYYRLRNYYKMQRNTRTEDEKLRAIEEFRAHVYQHGTARKTGI